MIERKDVLRLLVFLIFLAIWLLIDEKIKESYFFDLKDITKPVTHEFLLLVILICIFFTALEYFLKKR